ncbi:mitochondrial import receptor subunit TOM6 homolog [Phragmites australis]|uniref:mitochondrial import receptor subunit TOM6 homolog n=1 Tax=Phragmites australis TaxID=29695 RepID=UPI002D78BE9B|nr:mitochondrial import receptor subunit TOM6 homolog [Phragmites australis]
MFLGSIPRRPSKEAAYKQLKSHLLVMTSCVAVIRAAPYILHFLTRDGDVQELKLEF